MGGRKGRKAPNDIFLKQRKKDGTKEMILLLWPVGFERNTLNSKMCRSKKQSKSLYTTSFRPFGSTIGLKQEACLYQTAPIETTLQHTVIAIGY